MRTFLNPKITATIILFGTMLVAIGRGEVISYSGVVPLQALTGSGEIRGWYHPVNIPQFDPLLGQLQSIRFELSITGQGSFGLENLSDAPLAGLGRLSVLAKWYNSGLEHLAQGEVYVDVNQHLDAYDGSTDFGGSSGINLDNLTLTGTVVEDATYGFRLDEFTGTGVMSLPIYVADFSAVAWPSVYQSRIEIGALGTVSYFFSPIPEPSTWALFGVGMAVLACQLLHRTRRAR